MSPQVSRAEAPSRALVVDDDDIIRGFLIEALSDEGYDVRSAANGREALALLGDDWLPEVIVLDLMMPEMDGWTFRTEQRRLPVASLIPVVVLSATRDLHAQTESLDAAAVFAKPFDLDHLLESIARIVARPQDGSVAA